MSTTHDQTNFRDIKASKLTNDMLNDPQKVTAKKKHEQVINEAVAIDEQELRTDVTKNGNATDDQVVDVGDQVEVVLNNQEQVEMVDVWQADQADDDHDQHEQADDQEVLVEHEDLEPISSANQQLENLTNYSDHQDPAATMLPPHQQLAPEDPQVTFEIGSGVRTPITPLQYSSPALSPIDSALAGAASPHFSETAVDGLTASQVDNIMEQYYNSLLDSQQIPLSSLLFGNQPSVPLPSGIDQAAADQHIEQFLLSQYQQTMGSSQENNNHGNHHSLGQGSSSSYSNGGGANYEIHHPTSNLSPQLRLGSSSRIPQNYHHGHSNCSQFMGQLENGGSPLMRGQWTNIPPQHNQISLHHDPASTAFGARDIQYQRLLQSQIATSAAAAGGLNGSFYPGGGNLNQIHQLHNNIPIQPAQAMLGNFTDPYGVGDHQFPRPPPRMEMGANSWQDLVMNNPAASPNLHLAANNWLPQGQSSQLQGRHNYGIGIIPHALRPRGPIKSSLYDPVYESMGIPMDPHLRLFLAQQKRNSTTEDSE